MYEIVFHGRAGQGAKSAASIVAEIALEHGKFIQTFPEYGAARAGAPIRVFLRLDDTAIRVNVPIEFPDVIVVFDFSLLEYDYIFDGLKENSIIVANTPKEPNFIREKHGFKGKIFWLDATKISLDIVKKNLTNTAMLGAISKSMDFIEFDSAKKVFKEHFQRKLSSEIIDQNMLVLEKAFEATKEC